ncbi:MAG: fructose-specific PTS transporter subunit EIIC [Eubacterium sp.]|nr:fructose-specific PTS transporter subunit EIIC [Eubacterium sp.]
MKTQKFNSKFIIVIIIIVGSFIGSSLFFAAINATTLRSYMYENMSYAINTTKYILASDSESASDEDLPTGLTYWLCDSSGNILQTNATDGYTTITSYEEFNNAETFLNPPQEDSTYMELSSGENPFYTCGISCSCIRFSSADSILIIESDGATLRSYEDRQLALIFFVEIVLLVIVIILVTNNFFSYRSLILKMATIDDLTGLSNRKAFSEDVYKLMTERPESACLFLLDVDHFKQINDTYGHAIGDEALKLVSSKIKTLIQKHGYTAARWGGDEFIGILKISAQKAYPLLDNLCKEIRSIESEEGYHLTISVGLTAINYDMDLKKISEMADLALYRSKQLGRNRVTTFTPDIVPEATADSSFDQGSLTAAFHSAAKSSPAVAEHKPLTTANRVFTFKRISESIIYAVTWMVPFIAAGGILIGAAFLFDSASVDLASLSLSERGELGTITTIAETLNTLGKTCFNFMLPIFAAFMAYKMIGREAFVAGFVGGCMAIDSNAGFIGAMCAALVAAYITHHMKQFMNHFQNFMKDAMNIIILPVMSLLLMFLFSRFILTPVTSFIHDYIESVLEALSTHSTILSETLASALMATDMGGILNKAAYTYGTDSLSYGASGIMAAVMLGGMVPPLGIAISMFIFKKKYLKVQKGQVFGILFMGLSFITESVLPYVLTDFKRVIPSCIAGSAIAGFFSSLFGCTIPAPHGGVFVFVLSNKPVLYILSLLIGSFVTALILGLWKKPVKKEEDLVD